MPVVPVVSPTRILEALHAAENVIVEDITSSSAVPPLKTEFSLIIVDAPPSDLEFIHPDDITKAQAT